MKLSVELFEKTVEQLRGESVAQRQEKRTTPRVGLRCRIHLNPIKNGSLERPIEAWTRDISRMGMGAITSKKMKVGDHFLLSLPHEDPDDEKKALALYCTVRSCQEQGDGVYVVGFSFEDLRTKQVAAAAPAAKRESPGKSESPLQPTDQDRIRNAILG